jgi:hypothetical protein
MRLGSVAAVLGCAVAMLSLVACTGEAEKPAPKKPAGQQAAEKKSESQVEIPAGKGFNLAPYAKATASSSHSSGGFGPDNAKVEGGGEWATDKGRDENIGQWIQLSWDFPVVVHQVELEARANALSHIAAGHLAFSDNGTTVPVGELPDDGSPVKVDFDARTVKWVRFVIDKVGLNTHCAGLRKFRVFGEKADATSPPR